MTPALAASNPAIVAQAAEWAALLDDPPIPDDTRRAFAAWCAADPLHRTVFERMSGISARFDELDAIEVRTIARFAARQRGTRRIAMGLAGVVALIGGIMALDRSHGFHALWPDYVTAAGERRTITLVDGSRLVADTATTLDTFSSETGPRRIRLFEGQILATVSPRADAPFRVETAEGTATALGTVYAIERHRGRSVITVIESRVRVCASAGPCRTLSAGQRVAMTATGIAPLAPVDPEIAGLWASGWIEVHDRPLPEVAAELARYRAAPVRFDARALAGVRVTGSYSLSDPEAAFRSIAEATGLAMAVASDGTITLSPAAR